MPADPRRVKDLFAAAAAEIADPPVRRDFLDRECAGDADLRRRIDILLRAHDHPDSALEGPLGRPVDSGTRPFHPAEPRTATATPAGVPGTIVGGRYKLREPIGEGGMGEVWVADQLEPIRRRVALKLIKTGMDSRWTNSASASERRDGSASCPAQRGGSTSAHVFPSGFNSHLHENDIKIVS